MGRVTEIGYYRYEGFDLRTKFGWINGAAGLLATEPARIGMGNLGNAFTTSDDTIRGLLAPLGLQWHGHAAEAAAGALAQAAERAGTTGGVGTAGSSAVAGYGASFEEMRPKIAWQDPGSWDWWEMGIDAYGAGWRMAFGDTFDVQSDYMTTVEENRTLEARANEALYSHEQVSRERLAAFPVVEPASVPLTGASGNGPGGVGGASGYGDVIRSPPPPDPLGAADPLGADRVGIGPATTPTAPGSPAAVPGAVLDPPSAGRTIEERGRIVAAVGAELRRRGLGDDRGPHPVLAEQLRLLVEADLTLDLRFRADTLVAGIAARRANRCTLAVRHGGLIAVLNLPAEAAASALVGLVGPVAPGDGHRRAGEQARPAPGTGRTRGRRVGTPGLSPTPTGAGGYRGAAGRGSTRPAEAGGRGSATGASTRRFSGSATTLSALSRYSSCPSWPRSATYPASASCSSSRSTSRSQRLGRTL
jgi:hypothetical protein